MDIVTNLGAKSNKASSLDEVWVFLLAWQALLVPVGSVFCRAVVLGAAEQENIADFGG